MKPRTVLVENVSTALITDDATTIYTVPANTRAKWVLAYVINDSGSTVADVDLHIINGGSVPVVASKSLTNGEHLQFDSASGYIMLEAGTKIRARAATTGVSCILTLEETTGLVSIN